MRCELYNLVKRVYNAIGKDFDGSNKNGTKLLIKMVAESELQIRNSLFDLILDLNSLKESLNTNKRLSFNHNLSQKISSAVDTVNRGEELIFAHLKELLQPYWSIYWGEGCTDIDIIYVWIERAEQDNFVKIQQFKDKNK